MVKKIILGIFLFIVLAVGVLAIVIAMQPSHYQVERSAKMSAPPTAVFAQVNDFHKWDAWSPWAKIDPAMKLTFDGASEGKGAGYAWVGNSEVGEGRMTITESRPNELVKLKLEFIKPFASTCDVEFKLKPEGDQTNVTWTMSGENNFIGKGMCLFMSMDKMVGGDFEKGLAQMKTAAEAAAKK